MSPEPSKPIPFIQCEECCGPNGYHSSTCPRAALSLAEKLEKNLTPADFKFLRELRIALKGK
jgi:hypothetical protein